MRSIRKPLLAALVGAFALTVAAPAVVAQSAPSNCQGPAPCEKKVETKKKTGHRNDAKQDSRREGKAETRNQGHQPPRVGESARRAPQLQQAKNSRLPAPPKNQHYRVMDDRVVRVDDKTLKVVAVIGLASALLNAN